MIIAETCTFVLGCYTVQQRPRPDNPAWPVYIVFRGDPETGYRVVGRSFSRPDEGCCRWLERQVDMDRPMYAYASAPLYRRSAQVSRGGRPTNAERARRAAILAQVEEC